MIEGNFLISSDQDIQSRPDTQGRRWIPTWAINRFDKGTLESDIFHLKYDLIKKYDILKEGPYAMVALNSSPDVEMPKKIKSDVIKDYYDGIEKILKKPMNKKMFKKTLYSNKDTYDPYGHYNEWIVNNIKIKNVYLIEESPDHIIDGRIVVADTKEIMDYSKKEVGITPTLLKDENDFLKTVKNWTKNTDK
jgi:hypothetical protein